MTIDVKEWLNAIREDAPAGDDVSFSDLFDRIREARRADDPNLSQGDWEHELKVANWREVIDLAGTILSEQSKDLQAAVWLGEALISQHGLEGARAACELLAELQEGYWEDLYPQIDGEDLDERSAKLAWFNEYASQALGRLRMASGEPGYTLADWQLSREVDNLGRKNAEAYEEAIGEGKPTGDAFDTAVASNPDTELLGQHALAGEALAAFMRFKQIADARLGRAGPSFGQLEEALKRIQQIYAKAAKAKGLLETETASAGAGDGVPESFGVAAGTGGGVTSLNLAGGDAASKAAAIRALVEIANWFKRVEPHSPVSFLLERAVAWADTPLDQWLAEVVPDEATLAGIRSRIGLPG